jgi:hypothetical protein
LGATSKIADENAREEVKQMAHKINDLAYEIEDK